jgi:hypothetical protein
MNEQVSHKTFHRQHLLPKLPVPGLDDTCLKFIEWIQPLLTESEFNNTRKIVDQFRERGGDGEKLQKKLIEWSQRPDLTNWLEPFWNRKYLSSRIPLPINVNFSTVCDRKTRAASLRKAARKHVSRMKACMAGQGVERHLFGLLSIYEQFGKQIGVFSEPELFRDIGWLTLRHDTLSATSNPDPHGVVLSGFGPVVDDGVGICYTTINDRITIAITGKSNMQDSLEQFTAYLKRALREMSALLH